MTISSIFIKQFKEISILLFNFYMMIFMINAQMLLIKNS